MLDLTAVTPRLRPDRVQHTADQLHRRNLPHLLANPGTTWDVPGMDPVVTVMASHLPGGAVAATTREAHDGHVWVVIDPRHPHACAQARAMLADVLGAIPEAVSSVA